GIHGPLCGRRHGADSGGSGRRRTVGMMSGRRAHVDARCGRGNGDTTIAPLVVMREAQPSGLPWAMADKTLSVCGSVRSGMRGLIWEQLQVGRAVVALVLVLVVYYFFSAQRPANHALHDDAMFQPVLSPVLYQNVAVC